MWGWLAVGLSGVIHVSAAEYGSRKLSLMFRPIALCFLLAMLIYSPEKTSPMFWIIGGLTLSLCGDLLKMIENVNQKLIFVIFFLALACYSKSYWLQLQGSMSWWLPSLLLAAAVIAFFLFLPRLDSVVFPTTIMGAMLVQLCCAGTELYIQSPTAESLKASFSTWLFVLWGSLRGVNYYRFSSKRVMTVTLVIYLSAQILLVASVV